MTLLQTNTAFCSRLRQSRDPARCGKQRPGGVVSYTDLGEEFGAVGATQPLHMLG